MPSTSVCLCTPTFASPVVRTPEALQVGQELVPGARQRQVASPQWLRILGRRLILGNHRLHLGGQITAIVFVCICLEEGMIGTE